MLVSLTDTDATDAGKSALACAEADDRAARTFAPAPETVAEVSCDDDGDAADPSTVVDPLLVLVAAVRSRSERNERIDDKSAGTAPEAAETFTVDRLLISATVGLLLALRLARWTAEASRVVSEEAVGVSGRTTMRRKALLAAAAILGLILLAASKAAKVAGKGSPSNTVEGKFLTTPCSVVVGVRDRVTVGVTKRAAVDSTDRGSTTVSDEVEETGRKCASERRA